MAELDQDPSANTGRFRAFAERVERESADDARPGMPRGVLIGAGVLLAVILIIVLVVAL